eukprot:11248259-Alexandrium_andersonii.AAC.1
MPAREAFAPWEGLGAQRVAGEPPANGEGRAIGVKRRRRVHAAWPAGPAMTPPARQGRWGKCIQMSYGGRKNHPLRAQESCRGAE